MWWQFILQWNIGWEKRSIIHFQGIATGLEPIITQFINKHSTTYPNWPNDWAVLWVLICTVHLIVCSYHVTYAFQSESTLYSCRNVKEFLPWKRRDIWSLIDCNGTRTHSHLVHKRTLNHLAKLAKWSSCAVSAFSLAIFYFFLNEFSNVLNSRDPQI